MLKIYMEASPGRDNETAEIVKGVIDFFNKRTVAPAVQKEPTPVFPEKKLFRSLDATFHNLVSDLEVIRDGYYQDLKTRSQRRKEQVAILKEKRRLQALELKGNKKAVKTTATVIDKATQRRIERSLPTIIWSVAIAASFYAIGRSYNSTDRS